MKICISRFWRASSPRTGIFIGAALVVKRIEIRHLTNQYEKNTMAKIMMNRREISNRDIKRYSYE